MIARVRSRLLSRSEQPRRHAPRNGGGGAYRRADLRRLRPDPVGAQVAGGRGLHHLGLHDLAEPGFSGSRRALVGRFLKTGGPAMLRMPSDAAHDEQASLPRTRPPSCSLDGRSDCWSIGTGTPRLRPLATPA